ncbi:MAG: carbohydrate ABC transporter permease [Lachnospiraceae bacterium]
MTTNVAVKTDKIPLKTYLHPVLIQKKAMSFLTTLFRYVLLVCLGFIILTPILKMTAQAFTAQSALGLKNSVWIPAATSLQNMWEAWLITKYPTAITYSLLNAFALAVLQTACAALAAYSFARLKFKGSGILFGLVIFTIIVPSDSIMLAQYLNFRHFDIFGIIKAIRGEDLNLIGKPVSNYILALTGAGIKGGLYIYILRQSYRQLPISIEEAAYVDGCGFGRTFISIVIPGVNASLTTVMVLSFIWNYSDTYYSGLLSSTNSNLALILARMQTQMKWYLANIVDLMPTKYTVLNESPLAQTAACNAAAFLVLMPLLVMYLFVQKRFVQGVERSGLGGD